MTKHTDPNLIGRFMQVTPQKHNHSLYVLVPGVFRHCLRLTENTTLGVALTKQGILYTDEDTARERLQQTQALLKEYKHRLYNNH